MMLLAQTTAPDPQFGWNFILVVMFFLGGAAHAVSVFRSGKPQKREVTLTDNLVTKSECVSHQVRMEKDLRSVSERVEAVDEDLQRFKETIIKNGEERKNFIVGRVDNVRRELSEKMDRRIDDLPAQIIAMLKNTGAIK